MKKESYVYIVMNKTKTVLYIGVTDNLVKRIHQHKNKLVEGFTQKYNITELVYFEIFDSIIEAVTREKQLKNWKREWKIDLIRKINPKFKDLYSTLL